MANALSDDWFQQPYGVLLAQAQLTGAFVGPASHTTRWTPDTCVPYHCTVEQILDGVAIRGVDSTGAIREVFVPDPALPERVGAVLERCLFHAAFTDASAHYTALLRENRLKNRFERALHQAVAASDLAGFRYVWSFDNARNLVVITADASPTVVSVIQSLSASLPFQGQVSVHG